MAAEEYYVRIGNDLVKFLTWPGLFCTYVIKILFLQESFDAKFWDSIKFYNTQVCTIFVFDYCTAGGESGE